ncbi:MAG TPA: ABC transporter substrate-binding protein [Afipia sp.]
MAERDNSPNKFRIDRRTLLQGGAASVLAAPLGVFGAQAFPFRLQSDADVNQFPICKTSSDTVLPGPPRKLKLSWNAGAVCHVQVLSAIEQGFFKKRNLDVDLVNFSGSTDQLLEAIATGKSDAGIGMALRWLKPLEQGFDVKIALGTHGGCLRAIVPAKSDIKSLTDLKGKTIAVGDLAGAEKNFFSIQLAKAGVDPATEVDWRSYPGNLLRLAAEKGEVHAILGTDPIGYLWLKDGEFRQVASNLDGPYQNASCCIVGVRGSLVREDPLVTRALIEAVIEGAAFVAQNPVEAAKLFLPYAPKTATEEDLQNLVRYHTHHHHPIGDALKAELKSYSDDLKLVSVLKPTTDTTKFAEKIYVDVFSV